MCSYKIHKKRGWIEFPTQPLLINQIKRDYAAVTAAASGTTIPFKAVLEVTFYTVGATTTGNGFLTLINQGTTGIYTATTYTLVGTMTSINTTTANTYIDVTYVTGAATTASQFNIVTLEFIQ